MPQVARTTSGMQTPFASALQSLISTLKTNMLLGKSITASDMNQLINVYNSWIQHTHTAADLRGIDTFGNKSTYGTGTYGTAQVASAAKTTGGALFAASALLKAVNNDVLAGDANEAVNKINAIKNHLHTINDVTS